MTYFIRLEVKRREVIFALKFRFDALRIRMGNTENPFGLLFGHESVEDMVQKFVFLGDDRNIVQIWVDGQMVKDLVAGESPDANINGLSNGLSGHWGPTLLEQSHL